MTNCSDAPQPAPDGAATTTRLTRRRLLRLASRAAIALPSAAMLLAFARCASADSAVVVSTPTPVPTSGPTSIPAPSGGAPGSPGGAGAARTATAVRSASGTAGPAVTIELRPPQVGVGEAMRVRARVPGAATASVRFRGIDYQMLPQPDGSFWAVVGAPTEQAPQASSPVAVTGRSASGQSLATTEHACAIVEVTRPVDYLVASDAVTAVLTPDAGVREEVLRAQQFAAYDRTPVWAGLLRRPCPGDITTYFGQGRSINGGPVGAFHSGVDLADDEGTPVHAAGPGRVVWAAPMPIRGNSVLIDHGGGVKTGYHHLSAMHVQPGDVVEAGKTVGLVGMTGFATGPHLHWELTVWGVNVDPMTWLTQPFGPDS